MGSRKPNPYVVKAIVYLTVAVACFALLILKLYVWEERSLYDIALHERVANFLVVVIVVVVAYLLYQKIIKSID